MNPEQPLTRRQAMSAAATTAAALGIASAAPGQQPAQQPAPQPGQSGGTAVKNGRINQSVVQWCFKDHWDLDRTCAIAKELGCKSVEIVAPEHWPVLKKHGLICACTPSHGFNMGLNNPANWEKCVEILRKSIDATADAGFPNVITFTGFRRDDLTDEDGAEYCVEGFKKIVGHAEKRNVTLVLEMLNSRVKEHPMKGHPGYQGDSTEYCIDIIRRVASERLKLLFDIYHVQIMDGDVIARIRQYKDFIGHVHTAGNPGRGELDDAQEINYRGVMKALVDVGYTGYVGQEFIPTRDPVAGLRQAVEVCDV